MEDPGHIGFAAMAVLFAAVQAEAGATLDRVRTKKVLRCGVSEGLPGSSIQDPSGRWTGMDADFCRAVAATMGPSVKVEFVPLTASARFVALQMKKIDLLSRSTTWTLGREAHLGVQFVGVLYFDGQAFMVTRKSGINRAERLKGSTICVRKGTTTEMNLAEYSGEKALKLKATCRRHTGRKRRTRPYSRAGARPTPPITRSSRPSVSAAPGGAGEYVILPERISKEPTGPVVRRGDEEWFRLVKWVLFALIEAEEKGITRENAASTKKATKDPAVLRLLGAEGGFGKALGTDNDWALRAVQASGNYGEIFERNLGRLSSLKLDRGYNRLETKGGLMWAPPFR